MTTIQRDQQIKMIFSKAYNGGKNFCTPITVETGETETHFYEISKGRDNDDLFSNSYGVTFLSKPSHDKCLDKNKLFSSYQDAKDYAIKA
jgi:hypothetical protein